MKPKEPRNRRAAEAAPAEPKERLPALGQALGIPPTAFGGMPQITLSGNREALVDGCTAVLEYDENVVKLAAGKLAVRFAGRGLQIRVLTHDSAVVDGFITAIEFI
jgi:sporulation protein YqfC